MAILLKCGAVFLHIPKTGGNWVTEALEDQGLVFAHFGEKHCNMEQVNDFEKWFRLPYKYGKTHKRFFKFCFVRHPLRWYESWFKMQCALGWPSWGGNVDVWQPNAMLDRLGDADFNKFIRNVIGKRPGYVTELYSWYTIGGIDFIGKQENLVDDLIRVLKILEVAFDEDRLRNVEPVNLSSAQDIDLQDDLRQLVEDFEHPAFERYGYKPSLDSIVVYPNILQKIKPYPPIREDSGNIFQRISSYDPAQAILLNKPFNKEIGFAWQVSLSEYASVADDIEHPYRSTLFLLEDGKLLWQRHALHDDMRNFGIGCYSHWGEMLYFSTSDNTDPNTNGRLYQIVFSAAAD